MDLADKKMITYLIRKFDKWWLGQINIGLIHMTSIEYLNWRIWGTGGSLVKMKLLGHELFPEMVIKAPSLSDKIENIKSP